MENLRQVVEKCKDDFSAHFGVSPSFVAYAPGRINIIGEHTDYNQGLSMPCAINRWVTVSMLPRTDQRVNIISKDFNGEITFQLGEVYEPKDLWERYVYGCIVLFQKSISIKNGFEAFIEGNVPIGSGVSSSAALEVAFMNGLNHLCKDVQDPLILILTCQQVEHQFLKVKSGLLDQYASQFSKAGNFMVLDFLTLSHEYFTADIKGYVWVLCDTKVKRSLASTKYSERVEETNKAFLSIQKKYPEVINMRGIEEKHLNAIEDLFLKKRIRHYMFENKRVKQSLEALAIKDMEAFGNLITASHFSLRDDYEVSCEELDFLVEEAIATNCCLGSRMMGGGFGGCTINLVKKEEVTMFSKKISEAYLTKFHLQVEINSYKSVDGAGIYPVVKDVSYSS